MVATLVGVGFLSCNPNSIGRPCVNAAMSVPSGTQVSSPALECPSRLCLIQPGSVAGADGGSHSTCTAGCSSDDDCEAENLSQCKTADGKQSRFVCAVAVQAGPFCCRRMCVCREDLIPGVNQDPVDGGVIKPFSCDRKQNPNPTCPYAN
jgi:hypothetical protein